MSNLRARIERLEYLVGYALAHGGAASRILVPGTAALAQPAQILSATGTSAGFQGVATWTQATLALAATGATGSTPVPGIPNIATWWQSNLGVTQSAGVVSAWTDQTGNGFTLSGGATQPTYNAVDAAYNNQPTLSFNGSQAMTCTDPLSAQPYTAYVVGESTSGAGNQSIISTTANSANLYYNGGTSEWTMYAGANLFSTNGARTKQAYACVFNGASTVFYINTSVTPAATGNAGANASSGTLYVGGQVGPTNPLIGKVAAVLLYEGAHVQSQVSQVYTYLANIFAPGAWS